MQWADVNVLVGAFRVDAHQHAGCRAWLERQWRTPRPFAVSSVLLSAFVRVVTHPRIFQTPSSIALALDFCEALQGHPLARPIEPGPLHATIFRQLCLETPAVGKSVPDAWNAALAIEHRCTFVTLDRDCARFSGLRWASPLDDLGPGGYYVMEPRAESRVPVRHSERARRTRSTPAPT